MLISTLAWMLLMCWCMFDYIRKGEIMTLCPEMQTETKTLPVRERPATLKQKVVVSPNKPVYWPVIIILAATAGLSALGLFFCWKSPIGEWLHLGSNWFFKRQLVYLVTGVLGGVLAVYLAGWQRCVRAGPWLLVVWVRGCASAVCGGRLLPLDCHRPVQD